MIDSRKLDDLLPETKEKAVAFIKKAKDNGVNLIVTSTYRDGEAQNYLYAQGRTRAGKIVTQAKSGESYHNFRCALDVVPIVCGKPVWDTTDPENLALWRKIGMIGESCGLEWAGRWQGKMKEYAHFQFSNGLNLEQLREREKNVGIN